MTNPGFMEQVPVYGRLRMKHLLIINGVVLALAGCGGSGGGSSPDDNQQETNTGQLLDSEVQGVSYSTASKSGKTNADGEFEYRDGEVVEFRLGDLLLGAIRGQEVVSPIELVGAFSLQDETAVNVARLLQTLDSDGDPETGISLPDDISLPQDTDLSDEASILSALAGYDSSITTMVDARQAQNHLKSTLEGLEYPGFTSEFSQLRSYRNSNADNCSAAIVSSTTVTRNDDGTYTLDAAITLNGTNEVLSGNMPNPNLSGAKSDAILYTSRTSTPVEVWVNERKVILRWGDYYVEDRRYAADLGDDDPERRCHGSVLLGAADGVNVEPEIFGGPGPRTVCRSVLFPEGGGTVGDSSIIYLGFGARDRDGYVAGPGKLKVSGATEVIALDANGSPDRTYTGEDIEAVGAAGDFVERDPLGTWISGPPEERYTIKRDCSATVTWEYTVNDNKGASYTKAGQLDGKSPNDPTDDGSGSEFGAVQPFVICLENYSSQHCAGFDPNSAPGGRFWYTWGQETTRTAPSDGPSEGGFCGELGDVPVQDFTNLNSTEFTFPDGSTADPEPSLNAGYAVDDRGSCMVCFRENEGDECPSFDSWE